MNFRDNITAVTGRITGFFSKKKPGFEIPVSQRLQDTSGGAAVPLLGLKSPGGNAFRNRYFPYIALALIALMIGDLVATKSRLFMIPTSQPAGRKINLEMAPYKPRGAYDDIIARNIFNSDGLIPDIMVAGENGSVDTSGPARESTLALGLIGTIVHANPGKSVATIEFKNTPDKVLPYIPNDEIEGMATLLKVERKRVYIRNLQSGAIEYIQIKDEPGFSFTKKTASNVKQDGPVQSEGDNTYGISRNELETQMSNLPALLTQARAVPNIVNGRIDGFKITEMAPDALFAKFGVKDGDILKEVDGEKLDSPNKAMELYNSLRSKNKIQISGDRNGKPFTMTYNIR